MKTHAARIHQLDVITVQIDQLAKEFHVSWRNAALRAVSLNLITMQDLHDIQNLALQEQVSRKIME